MKKSVTAGKTEGARRKQNILTVLSTIMLVCGLCTSLTAGYYIWGTDFFVKRQQEKVVAQFEKEHKVQVETQGTSSSENVKHYDEPPTVKRKYNCGDLIGILLVPKNGLKAPMVECDTQKLLDRGNLVHLTDSSPLGGPNFVTAGHRRSRGSLLRDIDKYRDGDYVVINTGDIYLVYKFSGSKVILPSDYDVTAPVPFDYDAKPTKRLLTLISCTSVIWGAYGNDHRYAAFWTLEYWQYAKDGVPAEANGLF